VSFAKFRKAGRAPRAPGATAPPRTGGPSPKGSAFATADPLSTPASVKLEPQGGTGSGNCVRDSRGRFVPGTHRVTPFATRTEVADRSPSSGATPTRRDRDRRSSQR
jgi:hypothetical protein